jgi:WhiB family transcriptional regulator, redox-sensing transcriptional regulator
MPWREVDVDTDDETPWARGDPAGPDLPSLLELVAAARPRWHRRAACRGADPAVFYPGRGEPLGPARELCAGCPVRADCLEAGQRERYGVWAGMSERERRRARREAA